MRFTEVLIIPSAGHRGADGYTRGVTIPSIAEVEVVDKYVAYLRDYIDDGRTRVSVMATRTGPGLSDKERFDRIYPHNLAIHCCVGAHGLKREPQGNFSRVLYASKQSRVFAEEMAEALTHWGTLHVTGHRQVRAAECETDPLLWHSQAAVIRVEPFMLDGPDIAQYLRNLDRLGREMGRMVVSWAGRSVT